MNATLLTLMAVTTMPSATIQKAALLVNALQDLGGMAFSAVSSCVIRTCTSRTYYVLYATYVYVHPYLYTYHYSLQTVKMVMLCLSMALQNRRVGWKCATTIPMAQFAMTSGATVMPELYADS